MMRMRPTGRLRHPCSSLFNGFPEFGAAWIRSSAARTRRLRSGCSVRIAPCTSGGRRTARTSRLFGKQPVEVAGAEYLAAPLFQLCYPLPYLGHELLV